MSKATANRLQAAKDTVRLALKEQAKAAALETKARRQLKKHLKTYVIKTLGEQFKALRDLSQFEYSISVPATITISCSAQVDIDSEDELTGNVYMAVALPKGYSLGPADGLEDEIVDHELCSLDDLVSYAPEFHNQVKQYRKAMQKLDVDMAKVAKEYESDTEEVFDILCSTFS